MSKQAKISCCLPEEMILQILHKLPNKCLGKCLCVCKAWNFLIKNPSFISTHLNKTSTDLFLFRTLFYYRDKIQFSLHFDDPHFSEYMQLNFPFRSPLRLVGSCNGLVCLVDDPFVYSSTFTLWNPCIGKYIKIPRSRLGHFSSYPREITSGFGFDSRTNDYKILRVSIYDWDECIEVDLYSLKNNSWKSLAAPEYSLKSGGFMVFVNGVVHWIAYKRMKNCRLENLILGFHLGDEVFHKIRLPKSLGDMRLVDVYLTEYRETSSIAVIDGDDFSRKCHVWVMKEYGMGETWTKLLSIGNLGGVPDGLSFMKSGRLIFRTYEGKMVSYDVESSEIKNLRLRGEYQYVVAVSHKESLVLLDKGNGTNYDSNVGDSSNESGDASGAIDSGDESTDYASDASNSGNETDNASDASDLSDESTDDASNASGSSNDSTDDLSEDASGAAIDNSTDGETDNSSDS